MQQQETTLRVYVEEETYRFQTYFNCILTETDQQGKATSYNSFKSPTSRDTIETIDNFTKAHSINPENVELIPLFDPKDSRIPDSHLLNTPYTEALKHLNS